jgi:hypothetical protein
MLNISVDDFITLLTGVFVRVTEDGVATPQCVDLIQLYARVLGAPRFTGNAQDIYDQPGDHFIQIANTPTNFPLKGDIVILNNKYNGTVGDVKLCIGNSDEWKFTAFGQNDPLNSDSHTGTYAYTNQVGEVIVRGWLRPKNLQVEPVLATQSNPDAIQVPKRQIDYVIDLFNKLRGN